MTYLPNREIKFRAWDGEKMYPSFTLRELKDIVANIVGVIGLLFNYEFDSLVFMQYTGLKDKNGVEIYEGDIVSHDKITGTVVYSRYGFFIEFTQNNKSRISLGSPHPRAEDDFSTKCEVIGNIFHP